MFLFYVCTNVDYNVDINTVSSVNPTQLLPIIVKQAIANDILDYVIRKHDTLTIS